MIILYFYKNPLYLLILTFTFYLVSLLIIKYKKKIYPKIFFDNKEKTQQEFLTRLDKYYIKNKFYTFFAVGLYLFFQSGWIIVYRVFFINSQTSISLISPINSEELNNIHVFLIICFICLVIVTIILFKIMLDNLFTDEIIKLHLFFFKYPFYHKIKHMLNKYYFQNIFEKLYAFFFTVSRLEEKYYNHAYEPFYSFHYENKHIYENTFILFLTKQFVILAKKYKLFHYTIKLFVQLFKWLYYNMRYEGFAYYIPYIFLIIVMFYNITHNISYIGKCLFFFAYILIQILNYLKFSEKRCGVYDDIICRYFYKNSIDYRQQRILLNYHIIEIIKNSIKSAENKLVLDHMRMSEMSSIEDDNLVNYILSDCINKHYKDKEYKKTMKEYLAMHKRYYILSLFWIGVYYIILYKHKYSIIVGNDFNKEISILYIIVPCIIVISYIAFNIYKSPKDDHEDFLRNYIYRIEDKIFFWLFVIIFFYIFWLFIFKGNIFLISDGILVDYGYIKIIRFYSIEEKYLHFYAHLDNILNELMKTKGVEYHCEKILYLLEELTIKEFITEKTTIVETKILVEKFIENYFEYYISHLEQLKHESLFNEERHKTIKFILNCLSSIIHYHIFKGFYVAYSKAFYILTHPRSYEARKFVFYIIKVMFSKINK